MNSDEAVTRPGTREVDKAAFRLALQRTGFFDTCYVAEAYEIDGDAISPLWGKGARGYRPAGYSGLPSELAEVARGVAADGSEFADRAKAFVSEWGTLDTPTNVWQPETQGSLADMWRTSREVGEALERIESGHLEDAFYIIVPIVDFYTGQSLVYESPVGTDGGRMRWVSRLATLRGGIYWHLGNFAVGEQRLGRCQECGKFFERTDARQRFCPPSDYDGIGRPQSKCGLRFRTRKSRTRRRGGSDGKT